MKFHHPSGYWYAGEKAMRDPHLACQAWVVEAAKPGWMPGDAVNYYCKCKLWPEGR